MRSTSNTSPRCFAGPLLVTSEVDRTSGFERGLAIHQACHDGEWQPDPLILDDQAATRFPATSSVEATDGSAAIRRRVLAMDPIVVLLVVLIVLALVGSVAVSPLLWVLVVILVLFAVLGRGRYFARRG